MEDPLERLKQAGIANRDANQHSRDAMLAGLRAKSLEVGRRATSPIGAMASRLWWVIVGTILLLAGLFAGLGVLQPTRQYANSLPIAQGAGALAVALMLSMGLAKLAVRSSSKRELQWLETLPFRIHGHLNQLASSSPTFTLQFEGGSPDRKTLELLVSGCDVDLRAKTHRDPPEVEVRYRGTDSDHAKWRAWRKVITQLLLPLHAKFPISSVTFS